MIPLTQQMSQVINVGCQHGSFPWFHGRAWSETFRCCVIGFFSYQPLSVHGWTSAFLLAVHRLCGVIEGLRSVVLSSGESFMRGNSNGNSQFVCWSKFGLSDIWGIRCEFITSWTCLTHCDAKGWLKINFFLHEFTQAQNSHSCCCGIGWATMRKFSTDNDAIAVRLGSFLRNKSLCDEKSLIGPWIHEDNLSMCMLQVNQWENYCLTVCISSIPSSIPSSSLIFLGIFPCLITLCQPVLNLIRGR